MASPSAGSSRDAGAPPPFTVATPSNAVPSNGAPVDTAQLDRLCEKALAATNSRRPALAAGFFRRAVDEALRPHGDTFVRTFLTLQRAVSLCCQAQLDGVTQDEETALLAEAWELASSCLPLIVRRMDDNTMLPERGTAAELAFYKRFLVTRNATFDAPPWSTRDLQLVGLSMGYVTSVLAADVLIGMLCLRHSSEAEAFVLRVVDSMLTATRSLAGVTLAQETYFASKIHQALSGAIPTFDATFVASLRTKWTAAEMVQMRRERHLLDASEKIQTSIEVDKTRWRTDVEQHGLRHCALPSFYKREVCVRQSGVAPCGTALRSTGRCTGRSTSPSAAQPRPHSRLRMTRARAPRDGGADEALHARRRANRRPPRALRPARCRASRRTRRGTRTDVFIHLQTVVSMRASSTRTHPPRVPGAHRSFNER